MIEELTRRYLDAVDQALPGYVRGLYVVGSAALGAWQAGVSDLDTVVLTSRPATGDDLARLATVHAGLPRPPHLDGVYLEPALANSWPTDRPVAPFVVDGTLRTGQPCGELTPVLWLTLRRYGIPVRGPAVADLGIRVDSEQLRRYNLDNLRKYWQPRAATFPAELAEAAPDTVVDPGIVAWFVLGPARSHHTLTHGDIISKAAAGEHLARLFPEYADLARRAVRWRGGAAERFTATDLVAAGDSVHAVADDAWRRFGG
ncbi:nucleotidyltransferase domain-containing protein [Micromonospora sp. C28SCA-DRY-2]|uniref:nucleotidyltransferase domain-containing protein n=1 Tax=Micromonospora sp. C28SCA-DRY-2 TaxID=3059522 RepID=UPI002674CAB3|nr:nucleotidyltransferase domain-containing protein [Micromonospora sp. C28SCA-DRY-2]MDO3703309.1 nucleotidyltransferase domain-containing protein [Micromonospora sp. C28SCA-DRY-2]